MRYAKANAMLIQVPVLGTAKKFWRLSDKATRISRKLALILSSQHKIGFSIERVRDDYKYLAKVLIKLIKFSGGDISNLPPDYREFLLLIGRGTVTMRDEFLIVNNVALLPMENRTEVFLMLHDRIVNYRGREDEAKRKRILSKLPYKKDWLDTARANARINEWVTFPKKGMNQGVENVREYRRTPFDLLRLNRNIRCHLHQHNNDDIEETLYCEWPELLMVMEKMLYLEGELVATDIQNKFG
nr:hypothetical protein SEVIR_1G131900v2 [Setaria viridis]